MTEQSKVHPIFESILKPFSYPEIEGNPNYYAGIKPIAYNYDEHEAPWQMADDTVDPDFDEAWEEMWTESERV